MSYFLYAKFIFTYILSKLIPNLQVPNQCSPRAPTNKSQYTFCNQSSIPSEEKNISNMYDIIKPDGYGSSKSSAFSSALNGARSGVKGKPFLSETRRFFAGSSLTASERRSDKRKRYIKTVCNTGLPALRVTE